MANNGHIILDTRVDTTGITKGFSAIKSGASSVMGTIGKLGAVLGIAFGVSALVKFAKQSIELSSDVQEVQNVVDVSFGDMRDQMEAFADKAIETYGISRLTAKQTGSTYMAMAKGMGIAGQTAADMSLNLTGLSADMASFYNVSQKYTDIALKSVFTGETETLKQYGIVMTQTNLQEFARQQGITKSIQAMTQQEQTMLRYQYVMKQTQLAQGDFARTQDSWANQTRILSERWKEMQIVWGDAFRTIGTLILPAVNKLIAGLTKVAGYAKVAAQAIARMFGKEIDSSAETASNISTAVDNQNDLTEATKETTKAAKGQLAAYDEINAITKDTATGATSGGSFNLPTQTTTSVAFDTSDIEKKLDKLKNSTSPLAKAFDNLYASMKKVGKVEFKALTNLWNNTLKPMGDWLKNTVFAQIVDDIATSLDNSEEPLENFNTVLGNIAAHTFDSLQWLWDNILHPMGEWAIETLLPTTLDTLSSALETIDEVIEGAKPSFEWIWDNFFEPIKDFAQEAIITFLKDLKTAFEELSKWAKDHPEELQLITDIIIGFLATLWVYNTEKKIIPFIEDLAAGFKKLKPKLSSLLTPTNALIVGIALLAAGIIYLSQNWDKLSPAQRTITILGALAAALIAAAVAVGIFHTTWTGGIAAAAIVAGLTLLAGTYLFKMYNEKNSSSKVGVDKFTKSSSSAPKSIAKYAKYANMENPIPKLARGAVLPANKPFLAQLGDQKNGRNLEAPESLLRDIYAEGNAETNALLQQLIQVMQKGMTVNVDGKQLMRINREAETRVGRQTVTGGFANAY